MPFPALKAGVGTVQLQVGTESVIAFVPYLIIGNEGILKIGARTISRPQMPHSRIYLDLIRYPAVKCTVPASGLLFHRPGIGSGCRPCLPGICIVLFLVQP